MLKRVFGYGFLTIAAIISIFPFLWMIVSSTNKSVDVTKGRLLPGSHFMENLNNLLSTVDLVPALMNSAKISIITTLLGMLIASLAGYGFEIYQSKAKDYLFNFLLISMMIPFAALMVPLFRMFGTISQTAPWIGIDTISAVILPTVTTAFLIFFFRQSTKMFPKDILEAGRIDGLTELGVFFRI
jgi:lactose/L-arabinose transport system permease protein